MGWLDGQVALVTGGGSGLGRALVQRFLAEGARVGVLEMSEAKAADLRRDTDAERVAVTVGSVTEWDDNVAAVAATVEAFGGLDTFVANAGLWDFGTGLAALDGPTAGAAFDELFAVNVKGPLLGARAAVDALGAARGSIILTLSNAALHPGGGGPLYTASKHAGVGLVRQLAYELAPRVRVNAVAPGGMATDLRGPGALGLGGTSFADLPVDAIMRASTPLGIAPAPAHYTGAYVLLAAGDQSSTVTGAVFECDAGVGIRGRAEAERLAAELLSPAR